MCQTLELIYPINLNQLESLPLLNVTFDEMFFGAVADNGRRRLPRMMVKDEFAILMSKDHFEYRFSFYTLTLWFSFETEEDELMFKMML